jgi:pilus assembly protein CpaF
MAFLKGIMKTASQDKDDSSIEQTSTETLEAESTEDKVEAASIEQIAEDEQENVTSSTEEITEAEKVKDKAKAVDSHEKSINEIVDEVVDYFTIVDPIKLNMLERGKLTKEEFLEDVKRYIKSIEKSHEKREQILKSFASFVWSYDILDELIEDDSISDIKIYTWDHIRIKRLGKRSTSTLTFRNQKHYAKFVEHVALKNKVSISDQNAAQNFTDKESSERAILRFNITTGFINSNGKSVVAIRKILKHKYTKEQLINYGFFTPEVAEYLEKRAVEGDGMLFCGKGASGKTTCMNYLIDKIPEYNSGLVIQENEELFSNHPDMAFEHTVTNRGEGKIEYNLGDLARNGLLTDIDYFIIGEIKGGEALYLLNAVYTGAKGWASVHGASAKEAMKKLVDYVKYNSDYTQEEAMQMLVHLDTVIFMENFSVKEIAEVTGYDEEKKDLTYKMICENNKLIKDSTPESISDIDIR